MIYNYLPGKFECLSFKIFEMDTFPDVQLFL